MAQFSPLWLSFFIKIPILYVTRHSFLLSLPNLCSNYSGFLVSNSLYWSLYRVNELTVNKSAFFVLQRRRGHGESRGFSSLLVGTLDSVFDTKPAPYRILHQTPNAEVYYGEPILFFFFRLVSSESCVNGFVEVFLLLSIRRRICILFMLIVSRSCTSLVSLALILKSHYSTTYCPFCSYRNSNYDSFVRLVILIYFTTIICMLASTFNWMITKQKKTYKHNAIVKFLCIRAKRKLRRDSQSVI